MSLYEKISRMSKYKIFQWLVYFEGHRFHSVKLHTKLNHGQFTVFRARSPGQDVRADKRITKRKWHRSELDIGFLLYKIRKVLYYFHYQAA